MMSTAIIITLCCLLLLAYVFDVTSPHTRVPSVVLLLLLGWIVKQLSGVFDLRIPDLQPLLPILGSVGLILIVLEGSLDLELNRSKKGTILKTLVSAVTPIIILGVLFAWLLNVFIGYSFQQGLINVLPLCVISSSIAISTGRNLDPANREFVVYESSLSDIFGVLFFNFVVLNDTLDLNAVTTFSLQFLLVIAVSFIATVGLAFLLRRINHHIKFAPIILLVILIYEISKVYHLPALIFILLFGLFIGNLEEFKKVKWIQALKPAELQKEVIKFREITTEATFLIRALFFLLFGYLIETRDIMNIDTFAWSAVIVAAIFAVRAVVLKLVGSPLLPLLFIAPRGLITILLYFAIPSSQNIPVVNNSLILQVILLTAFIMMIGMITTYKKSGLLAERHEVV
jgi:potassium/hydrogen antiporter